MDNRHWSAETYEAQRTTAWARFGRMVRRWRLANGWTQYLGERIQKELGILSLSPSNWSNIESGKAGQMKPATFWKFAELNSRVHHDDWPPIHSRDLKTWLSDSRAIVNDAGEPWGPCEFWACATGQINPPAWLDDRKAPEISDSDAETLCESWSDRWRQLRGEYGVSSRMALEQACAYAPVAERDTLGDVFNGDCTYTAAELMASWDGDWLPARALDHWGMQLLHKQQDDNGAKQDAVGS